MSRPHPTVRDRDRHHRGRLAAVALAVACATVFLAASCSSTTTDTAPPNGNGGPGGPGGTDGTVVAQGSTADAGTAAGWPGYRHDLANTGASPAETIINRGNVAKLTKSWSKSGVVGVSGTPAVADGVAYFGDWQGTMWAVKADTGDEVWHTSFGAG